MYIKTTFFRVNFVINVTDEKTGEVYMSADSNDAHAYDCTLDEAFQEVLADISHELEHVHPYVVKKCTEAVHNMYENNVYDLNVYMQAEDNLIKLCADVTIHAEI